MSPDLTERVKLLMELTVGMRHGTWGDGHGRRGIHVSTSYSRSFIGVIFVIDGFGRWRVAGMDGGDNKFVTLVEYTGLDDMARSLEAP